MSQELNSDTSIPKTKRPYRKGHRLSDADKQRASSAKRRATLKEVKVFIEPRLKELLMRMCQDDGLTQAKILSRLIECEVEARKNL